MPLAVDTPAPPKKTERAWVSNKSRSFSAASSESDVVHPCPSMGPPFCMRSAQAGGSEKCTRHRAHARTPRRQQAHYPLYVARSPRALCSLCETPPGVCAHYVRSETRRLACAHYAHSVTRPRHPCALCSLDGRKPPRYHLVHDTLGWTQRFVSTPVRGSMHVSNHPRRCGACV